MERLTIRNDGECRIARNGEPCYVSCEMHHQVCDLPVGGKICSIQEVINKLAHYEDLAEQGRLFEITNKKMSVFRNVISCYMGMMEDAQSVEFAKISMMHEVKTAAEARLAELEGVE